MANTSDAAFVALGNMGYTGSLQDRLNAFWAAGGGGGGGSANGARTKVANSTAPSSIVTGNGSILNVPMISATVPANTVTNTAGSIVMTAYLQLNSSASAKGLQVFFGGVKVVNSTPASYLANVSSAKITITITSTNGTSAQITTADISTANGTFSTPLVSSTVDMSKDQNLGIYSELTTSGDTEQVLTWLVEKSN